ncbi:PolC-type DNA polymerase III [Irregularibacter muris]|uniref:DNA polymerase III PolC-type n=1 Tax=Irregularibacter muris TaxID=1796619 RepID=A0AAE3KYS8_9FIRM|nr:PolC-type DNA polymerase III [Irregularibacter muris]MCR1898110.1 PolC-type DNA polymerase III [Irregularibacter muris]
MHSIEKKNKFFDKIIQNNQFTFLNNCQIKKVKVNKDLNSWEIILEGPFKIENILIKELENYCLTYYPFVKDIHITYREITSLSAEDRKYNSIQDWYTEGRKELFLWVKKDYPSIISSIPLEDWKIDNNILIIKADSQIALESIHNRNIPAFIREKLSKKVIQPFKVEFIIRQDNVDKGEFHNLKEKELRKIIEKTVVQQDDSIVKTANNENHRQEKSFTRRVIKGKNITGIPTHIEKVSLESGTIIIQGHVFDLECRLFNNNKGIITFNITDYSNSITVKAFDKKDALESMQEDLTENPYVRVKGEVQFDKYSREIVVMAKDVQLYNHQEKIDTCEEKRVELHVHSQFSAMDGISNIKSIIEQAARWGHQAIAVTDHGVLQAYPDAMNAGKKNNIKVIYGVEGYLVDDDDAVVWGENQGELDQTFIVFDIETTGLSPDKNQITEIGAVKIKNQQVIDRFSTLINPECPIPLKITELTGITDEMVENQPKISEVLPTFLEFCDDAVLVAHNAKFDISFIKNKAFEMGRQVNNTILDTLALARMSLPQLKRHRLNNLAKYFDVKLLNHHRAVDDAEATAEIFMNLINMAKDKGANKLKDLNFIFTDKNAIKKMDTFHVIILVKNQIGLKNLYKIVSMSHIDYFYRRPRIPKSLLTELGEGLIIGTACEAGELYRALLRKAEESELKKLISFYDYLEIQPIENNKFLIEKGIVENSDGLKEINKKIVELGEKYNKPVVATCDVHFLQEHDKIFREILMTGQGFSDANNQPPLYLRTTDEMLMEFEYLGEKKCQEVVIKNTNLIAEQIEEILPIPQETFPPKIDGAEDDIYNMTMTTAHKIYGEDLPEVVQKRLDKELNSIISNGYAVLYLIAHKLVAKSLQDGYLVGSRGSVGSSLVATFTDITEVNPLPPHYICPKCKHSQFFDSNVVGVGPDLPDANCPVCNSPYKKDGFDIPFEVFLGFEGDKEPDIDLNFSGEYQPVAHRYTEELFGKGQVFRAGTIGTIADKTAYGFVKNYVDEKEKVLHNAEMNRLVRGCTGIKRSTGQHPGGIMVVPADKEIYDFSPIQRPADDQETDIITTHFDYHSLSGRLLKLDILGHDDPTVIRMLEDLTGMDATKIPLDDEKTMSIFTSPEALNVSNEDIGSTVGTFGIPEFGTRFVRQMLEDTKPTAFADLIRISGLSHGTDVWLNNAQELVRNNTCSIKEVISTRDDIMVYLIYKGLKPKYAFKIMESVRKGRGLGEEDQAEMEKNGVPQWYIESCKKIKYMFPKAHASAYVMMAFRIAYFKVHFPLAFYATYFSVRADDFDADLIIKGRDTINEKIKELEGKGNALTVKERGLLTVLEIALEMYCRGFKVLPVDLYKSHADKFILHDDALLAPFNSLQGLGIKAAYSIMQSREEGKFISKEDLRERSRISKTVIEILDQHGSLEGLPDSNQLSLF